MSLKRIKTIKKTIKLPLTVMLPVRCEDKHSEGKFMWAAISGLKAAGVLPPDFDDNFVSMTCINEKHRVRFVLQGPSARGRLKGACVKGGPRPKVGQPSELRINKIVIECAAN